MWQWGCCLASVWSVPPSHLGPLDGKCLQNVGDVFRAIVGLPGVFFQRHEKIAPVQKMIGDRQISRLGVVGSNDVTAPVIEESYHSFLRAFDAQLQQSRFLFGERPASSDFGIMGQLTCLALFDPTPSAITADLAPRVYAWTEWMEDLSGTEVDPERVP